MGALRPSNLPAREMSGAGAPGGAADTPPGSRTLRLWQSKRVGDFAAAIILAHEFGHHIENELYQQSVAAGQQELELKQGNKNRELIADCFAGVWAGTKYYDGLMEPGDFDEAVAAIETIGDVAGAPESHGPSEERKAALIYGYQGDAAVDNIVGTPQQCIAQYWR